MQSIDPDSAWIRISAGLVALLAMLAVSITFSELQKHHKNPYEQILSTANSLQQRQTPGPVVSAPEPAPYLFPSSFSPNPAPGPQWQSPIPPYNSNATSEGGTAAAEGTADQSATALAPGSNASPPQTSAVLSNGSSSPGLANSANDVPAWALAPGNAAGSNQSLPGVTSPQNASSSLTAGPSGSPINAAASAPQSSSASQGGSATGALPAGVSASAANSSVAQAPGNSLSPGSTRLQPQAALLLALHLMAPLADVEVAVLRVQALQTALHCHLCLPLLQDSPQLQDPPQLQDLPQLQPLSHLVLAAALQAVCHLYQLLPPTCPLQLQAAQC